MSSQIGFLSITKEWPGGVVLRCVKYAIVLKKRLFWGEDAVIKRLKPFRAKMIVVLVSPYKILYGIKKYIGK